MQNKLECIGKYYNFEEKKPTLSNSTYYIEEKYKFSYLIENKSAYQLKLELETDFNLEISLSKNKIEKNTKDEFFITLKPTLKGKKSFKLFAKIPRCDDKILEKIFNVELKNIAIEAKIDKPLPTSMKLGQKAETIFLFTNTGNQTVTGVNIDIKQIESTE